MKLVRNGHNYIGDCERFAGYPGDPSADWALCLMGADMPFTPYETVSLRIDPLRKDRQLTLAGYGCVKIGAKSDGVFRYGPSWIEYNLGQVTDPPTTTSYPNWVATYPTATRGGAFVCEGDSGGAVFQEDSSFERVVVAVNSNYGMSMNGTSYLSVLGTGAGERFLRKWASQHNQTICGVTAENAPNCRR